MLSILHGWVIASIVVASGIWSGLAGAFEFSAERVYRSGGKTVQTRVYARDDRWRLEYLFPQSGSDVVIVRQDLGHAWHLFPRSRTYVERPVEASLLLHVEEAIPAHAIRVLIGHEERNGFPCDVFDVTLSLGGRSQRLYQWVTREQRFVIKTVHEQDDWSVEYRNVRFSAQSSRLFEPPYAYSLQPN